MILGSRLRPPDKPSNFNLKRAALPFYLWIREAATFYPWEVVSSYELAPKALFFLPRDNFIRKPLIRLVRWKLFDWTMLLVILANCVTLAMASNKPGFGESALGQSLSKSNYVFIAIFMVEATCKIVALGFLLNKYTYLRNPWNLLDFVVVCMGILELTSSFGNYTFIRCFRVLRPLRAVTKIESLKLIVEALVRSLPMLGDVVILAAFYMSIFGIVCLELFRGKFGFRCGTPDFSDAYTEYSTVGDQIIQNVSYSVASQDQSQLCKDPMAVGHSWINTSQGPQAAPFEYIGGNQYGFVCPWMPTDNPYSNNYPNGLLCVLYGNPDIGGYRNFDNIFYSFIQVFQHLACQDWSQIMYATQATMSWWTWLLHYTMVLIGGYLIANLTLAVVFINFNKNYSAAKSASSKSEAAAARAKFEEVRFEELELLDDQSLGFRSSPQCAYPETYNAQSTAPLPIDEILQQPARQMGVLTRTWERMRDFCYIIQDSQLFQHTTTTIIILNAITLAIIWYDMPDVVANATQDANFAFTVYFFSEMVIKLVGLGFTAYLADNFNIFDALVTTMGVVEMIIILVPNVTITSGMSVFRAFRLLRIFRLARKWKSLNRILRVLLKSLAAVGWVTVLLILFLFIVGLLGMTFFGYKLDMCGMVPGSVQLCPPGLTWRDCPSHFDCYIACDESLALQWYQVPGSPYGNQAYCEVFPRAYGSNYSVLDVKSTVQFWAQVGKPTTYMPNYDDIYEAIISGFIMLTQDNWDVNMKSIMVMTGPWLPALFTIITMIVGIYTVLNLFLAVLLANLDEITESAPNSTSHSHAGDTNISDGPKTDWGPEIKVATKPSAALFQPGGGSILDKATTVHTSFWVPKDMQKKLTSNLVRNEMELAMVYNTAQFHKMSTQSGPVKTSLVTYSKSSVVPLPPILQLPLRPLEEHDCWDEVHDNSLQYSSAPYPLSVNKSSLSFGARSRSFMRHTPSLGNMAAPPPAPSMLLHPVPVAGGEAPLEGKAMFFLDRENKLRQLLYAVVNNVYFEFAMLFIILLSSLELCFATVLVVPGSVEDRLLNALDIFFTATFAAEALMKVMTYGFLLNGSHSYLRQPWNVLDFVVVVVGILILALEHVMSPSDIKWLRAFRAMRVLRPLRVATRIDGIRVVVTAMARAIPAIGEIFLVGSLFYYIFAVLGVNLMCGLFLGCYSGGSLLDPYYLVEPGATINKTWCEVDGGNHNISNSYYHASLNITVPEWSLSAAWGANGILQRFDNVIMALWVLFQVSSLENWSPVMIQAMDSTSLNSQPLFNANVWMALYFLVFVVLGVFFILNMVIGVAISQFNKLKEESGKSAFLTDSQQQWLTVQRMMAMVKPKAKLKAPSNAFRRFIFRAVVSDTFDSFMIVVIMANIVSMMMTHEGESQQWQDALTLANAVFTGVYGLEMFLKWMALGLPRYFRDGWCQFDFVVVVVSVAGVIMDYTTSENLSIMPLLRVLRVLRIIKLVPKARGLKLVMLTLMWSLPALFNVAAVLFLFMYIYAIIGMNIFGNLKFQSNLDNYANFQTFPSAMFLLFRMQSGENWDYLMTDCMVQQSCIEITQHLVYTFPDNGTNITFWPGQYLDSDSNAELLALVPLTAQKDRCTPSAWVTALYFCSYMMVCVYLVLELVIGVIIENIEMLQKIEKMRITQQHLEMFVEAWEEIDVNGSGYIHAADLTSVLLQVLPPLGVKGVSHATAKIQQMLQDAEIPLRNNGHVHFIEALHSLSGRVVGDALPDSEEIAIRNRMIQKLPKDELPPKFHVGDYYAALHVKAAIKGYLVRAHLKPAFDKYELSVKGGGGPTSSFSTARAQRMMILKPLSSLLVRSGTEKEHEAQAERSRGGAIGSKEGAISSDSSSSGKGGYAASCGTSGQSTVEAVPGLKVTDSRMTTQPYPTKAGPNSSLHEHNPPPPVFNLEMSPFSFQQQSAEEVFSGDLKHENQPTAAMLPSIATCVDSENQTPATAMSTAITGSVDYKDQPISILPSIAACVDNEDQTPATAMSPAITGSVDYKDQPISMLPSIATCVDNEDQTPATAMLPDINESMDQKDQPVSMLPSIMP